MAAPKAQAAGDAAPEVRIFRAAAIGLTAMLERALRMKVYMYRHYLFYRLTPIALTYTLSQRRARGQYCAFNALKSANPWTEMYISGGSVRPAPRPGSPSLPLAPILV